MDNMISVINDNLKNVVNGVKTHKGEISTALTKIKADMEEKTEAAERLKSEVEESKETISSLENEISTLETDLEELTSKFGDDFKETVAAGNKEINSKIIKDRAAISAESSKIEELTSKAKLIKEELLNLKDKKEALEINLSDTSILESYYSKRIDAIIDYSIQHTSELDKFQDEEVNLDLITSLNSIQENDLENNVDDNIFNEIDDISDADLAEIEEEYDFGEIAGDEFDDESFDVAKQLDSVIDSAKEFAEEMEEKSEDLLPDEEIEEKPLVESDLDKDDEEEYVPFGQLPKDDDEEESHEPDPDADYVPFGPLPTDEDTEVEINDEYVPFGPLPEDDEENEEDSSDDNKEKALVDDVIDPDASFVVPFDFTQIKPIDNDIDIDVDDDLENNALNPDMIEGSDDTITAPETISDEDKEAIDNVLISLDGFDDQENEEDIDLEPINEDIDVDFNESDDMDDLDISKVEEFDPLAKPEDNELPPADDDFNLDEMPVYEGSTDNSYYDETTRELADLVKGIQENEDTFNAIPENNDIEDFSAVSNEDNIYGLIQKNGLFVNSFNQNDLDMMDATVKPESFELLINTLDKHSISKDALYNSAKVIEMNNPVLVDDILTELDKTDAINEDIKVVLPTFDKVNLDELKMNVNADDTDDLTGILFKSMPTSNEEVIGDKLNLQKNELKKLKNNTTDEEYAKMNMFADLVITNFNTLKNKGVNDPVECFINHPQRFLFNPSRLNEIFDKYDDDDLVRCINKNSAVIDKL